ncbi:SIR2 family protein [Enterococcus hulanensis]|uniref:SIR2 family protein n=1 Tax=Enterococcus hulanensis TaxID=2559929 RepID=UPI001A8E2130|nr:SIR2 family protein [Enterococcus hulanensis]MBO0455894.1 SIR2 family protein [Enterococcus hulanensis]
MENYYTETEFNELVNSLVDAVGNFNLVVFIGAGISLSQGYPNWNGYIEKLIHFWQFNIRNFEETEGKIDNKLLTCFDEILKSSNTNKRKIDLLHTLLNDVLGEKFSEVKLDFEKYFFNNVVPDYIENSILTNLIKLNPMFITSNYDFEIERHLKRSKQKGTFIPINNLREFRDLDGILRSNDVLHLHGTTNGDSNFFVNSSYDYSRQYLKQPDDFNKLRKWFQDKNPVVLFLGSSMEEEEILSLLPATTKNFALMKANSNETDIFRNLYNKTYQKNNNTTIFWYGDSYDVLDEKLNEIITAVQSKLDIPESIDDWSTLHTIAIEDDLYKSTLEKYIEDDHFLFDIFKTEDSELVDKILRNIFSSDILFEKVINISSFLVMLNKNFEKLDKLQVSSIIQGYKSMKLNIHWVEVFNIFERIKNLKEVTKKDLNEIRKNLSYQQDLVRTAFSSDAILMGYWLTEQLQSTHSYFRSIYHGDKIISIELSSEMIPLIVEQIADEFRYRYKTFKDILSDDLIEIIYESLLNEKVFLDDTPIFEKFPESLLETRLFQRILVNIDNKNKLNDSVINNLIKIIDFTDNFFGHELNTFIDNHKVKLEEEGIQLIEEYRDGISKGELGIVHPKSFIDNHQILGETVENIVEILLSSQEESMTTREDFYSEKTHQATSDFLISSLKRNDEISNKIKEIILKEGYLLYPKYEKLFMELLASESDEYDSELQSKVQNIFLENFDLDVFSWEEKQFFEVLIDKEKFNHPAFERLLQVNVNKLNYDYGYSDKTRPELIDVNDFINTELGRYLALLIQLNKKSPSKQSKIKNIVSTVKSKEFREFTQGALSTVESPLNIDKITINTFQGYCYSLYGFKKEDLEEFVPAGKELLIKGYVNDFNKNNLFILSLFMINPEDDNMKVKWAEINFSQLIDVILQSKIEYQYENQWIKEVILNDRDGQYGRSIVYSLTNDDALIEKSEKVFEIFERNIKSYSRKIDIDLLPDSIKEQKDVKKKDLLYKLFFLLLDNAKIAKSYFGSDSISNLMKQLDSGLKKRLVSHPNLPTVLSPLEIENLRRQID